MRQDGQDPKDPRCIFKGLNKYVCVVHARWVLIPLHRERGPGGPGGPGSRGYGTCGESR